MCSRQRDARRQNSGHAAPRIRSMRRQATRYPPHSMPEDNQGSCGNTGRHVPSGQASSPNQPLCLTRGGELPFPVRHPPPDAGNLIFPRELKACPYNRAAGTQQFSFFHTGTFAWHPVSLFRSARVIGGEKKVLAASLEVTTACGVILPGNILRNPVKRENISHVPILG